MFDLVAEMSQFRPDTFMTINIFLSIPSSFSPLFSHRLNYLGIHYDRFGRRKFLGFRSRSLRAHEVQASRSQYRSFGGNTWLAQYPHRTDGRVSSMLTALLRPLDLL